LNIVERIESVGAGLAHRAGDAGIERARHERVATAEAEGTDTTVAIHCIAVSSALDEAELERTHESSRVCLTGSGCPWCTLRRREQCRQGLRLQTQRRWRLEPCREWFSQTSDVV
jgi:hypothetical protein